MRAIAVTERSRPLAHAAAAVTYAAVGLATVWGTAPRAPLGGLVGNWPAGSPISLVVATLEVVGALALVDSELAPLASVVLSAGMLAASLLAAYVTRDARRVHYRVLRRAIRRAVARRHGDRPATTSAPAAGSVAKGMPSPARAARCCA
jgi:hypothetical protein